MHREYTDNKTAYPSASLGTKAAYGLVWTLGEKILANGVQVEIRLTQFQILKEYTIEVVVVILAGMDQQSIKVLTAFSDYC